MTDTMPDARLPPAVGAWLERHGVPDARVVALTGDASDRRYLRVLAPARDAIVLAVHAQPFESAALPFLNVAALLAAMPLPVPRVLGVDADLGVLALEDLGDVTLQAHVGTSPAGTHAALYRQAVAFIDVLQRRGREMAGPGYLPYTVAFDTTKLAWELEFFVKYFVEAYRGVHLSSGEREALNTEFASIVEELAAEPRVLCHRDFHSRNLMLRGGQLVIIDFQDARMGPDTYDLASLLRDAYVDVPAGAVRDLMAHFLSLQGRSGEAEAFRPRFTLMALQRTLKALGTFGHQAAARHHPVYIQYIPRALEHVREDLASAARFGRLRDVLAAGLEELR
jgi:N-acetylmuramate 1-kinase